MIGYDGITFGFHRFQNDTKTTVPQSSFDDPLDGTGASGMTLDQTKLNAWEIRFQYLGSGKIELWVMSQSTGQFVLVHTVHYTNQNTTPSVFNTNFKFTMWVDNKATTTDLVIKCASVGYFIEGKNEFLVPFQPHESSGVIQKTTITTEVALFTIRSKTTYVSKTNFIDSLLEMISASIEASSANNLGSIRLVRNTSLGGSPSYSDLNTSDSTLEIDIAGTTLTGGEDLIDFQLAGKNDKLLESLSDYKFLLFPGDTITVGIQSANSATFKGSLLIKEIF